jgi:DNA modification methylase
MTGEEHTAPGALQRRRSTEPPPVVAVTRTELVWPGKYDPDGRRKEIPHVSLPFQVIETVNESRATREVRNASQRSLFDVYEGTEGETFEDGWTNKLIWGNNLLVMSSLLEKFAGKIDLIYIDPPFATGADFSVTAQIGEANGDGLKKAQSALEEKVYRDTWGRGLDSYLSMLRPRLELMRDLLSDIGTLWVHLDWHVGHYVKLLLDEIFGQDAFLNEVVRVYAGGGQSKDFFPRKHDLLFVYTKGERWIFNGDDIRVPYDSDYKATVFAGKGTRAPGKTYTPNEMGKIPEDWWLFNRPYGDEIIGYPTQKPEALLERIIKVSSRPGSIVADFFVGSGTAIAVAEKLERRWIGCDLGRFAIHTTRKRLLAIEGCKPFELLNLGRYERQFWQVASFGGGSHRSGEIALYEYLAFMLRLYGASVVPGLTYLHGKRGRAMVHIGAVDAPVTIGEVNDALDECSAMRQSELHILGWEWEMGLAEPNGDYRNQPHGGHPPQGFCGPQYRPHSGRRARSDPAMVGLHRLLGC